MPCEDGASDLARWLYRITDTGAVIAAHTSSAGAACFTQVFLTVEQRAEWGRGIDVEGAVVDCHLAALPAKAKTPEGGRRLVMAGMPDGSQPGDAELETYPVTP
jgi:hypothetical protein